MDWYFDFISPYAYLQNEILLREHPQLQRRFRPALFGGLLKHWGGRGPAEIAPKRVSIYRHCQWLAERHAIAMRFPPAHPFNPLPPLRLAVAHDAAPGIVTEIFRAIFAHGIDPENLQEICARAGIDSAAIARTESAEVKNALRAATEQAAARGVFGVPTLAHAGQLFWGVDMTEMALQSLQDAAQFERGEYARLGNLPVAMARKL